MPEDKAVASLLEWVEAVQQEAPGAVMGLVWTHADFFVDGVCGGADGQEGFLRVVGSASGEMTSWIAMRYVQQLVGPPCVLKDVGIFKCRSLGKWSIEAWRCTSVLWLRMCGAWWLCLLTRRMFQI